MKTIKIKQRLIGCISVCLLLIFIMSRIPLTVFAQENVKVFYSGFMFQQGWSGDNADNTKCTTPRGSYVTAIRAGLLNQPADMTGTIEYQVNLSGSGWQDWVENYKEAGALDTEMPLEAVRMRLTGQLKENYDLYYRVLQNGNWTDWALNEATSGIEGVGLRLDGLRVSVVPKGLGEPEEIADKIDPSRPMVALTFDDGPSAPVTNRILNVLEANGGRATFFMVGNRVPSAAACVQRMVALDCEVANHTYDHKYLTNLTDSAIRSQVNSTNQNIINACGVKPVLLRPTGGNYNKSSLSTLASLGMPAIMWSIDTLDWKTRNAQKTINSVLNNVKDGDIILMHDIHVPTADAVEVIVPALVARGYQLVTVSELASYRGGMAPGHVYTRFRP